MTPILAPVSGRLRGYGCHRMHADVALPAMHPYASEGDSLAVIAAPAGVRCRGRFSGPIGVSWV